MNDIVKNKGSSTHQIHALYGTSSIRVYQAYSAAIADAALARGTFAGTNFKMNRMTWIKPSFLWMMYRSGWGFKDAGQERILAIDISREGFEWALMNSCSTSRNSSRANSGIAQVLVQWDPDRDLLLQPMPRRAIQIGLRQNAVDLYVNEWILAISDITDHAHQIKLLVEDGKFGLAEQRLPPEIVYPLPSQIAERLSC